jgi:hypothetical protein
MDGRKLVRAKEAQLVDPNVCLALGLFFQPASDR